MTAQRQKQMDRKIDSFIRWVGSFSSLIIHTLLFFSCLVAGIILGTWDMILIVLTTLVSLEAIYLAIFIQMSINRNTESLQEVEKDIDEIQDDIDEIQEDVEEIAEDVVEIQEDDKEDDSQEEQDRRLLKDIQNNLLKITADLEELQKNKQI